MTPDLTRDTVLALAAGRELNILIAERVMGLIPHQESEPHDGGTCYDPEMPPRYSSDIKAAWRVVEKLDEHGFHAVVKSPFTAGEPYHAGFTPHGQTGWNGRPDYAGSGDTMPLAVCRAALLTTLPPS